MTGKDKKFTELLNAYLEGEVSPVMQMELMRLIKSGEFDDIIKNKIDENFNQFDNDGEVHPSQVNQLLSSFLDVDKQPEMEVIAGKKYKLTWWKWSAAACLLIGLGALAWSLEGKNKKIKDAVPGSDIAQLPQEISSAARYIHLQDGSTVLLNKGSKLEYPDSFGKKAREVTLSGEAYFDIKHDAERTFVVHTGKVKTTVLGTAFNVKAYPEQKEIIVTVTRGKVNVSDDEKILATITPNESLAVNKETKLHKQQKVNAEQVVEWKKQYLVLDNISLGDAAALINTRYHVSISFAREELKDCRISATFLDNQSLEQVLDVVSAVVNASYSTQPNDKIIISGEGCK